MALDRYLAIVHPVGSIGWRTVRKTAVVLAITWVINTIYTHCIRSLYSHYVIACSTVFIERNGVSADFLFLLWMQTGTSIHWNVSSTAVPGFLSSTISLFHTTPVFCVAYLQLGTKFCFAEVQHKFNGEGEQLLKIGHIFRQFSHGIILAFQMRRVGCTL